MIGGVVVIKQKKHKKEKKKKKEKKEKKEKVLTEAPRNEAAEFERDMRALEETRQMNERLMTTESHNVELWLQWARSQDKLLGQSAGEALRVRQQAILEQGRAIFFFQVF